MDARQIVIDTNVLVSALRSRKGASFRLLSLIDSGRFRINVSVPLVLEYEDACARLVRTGHLANQDIANVIDYIIAVANRHTIYFLWRPLLKDSDDDMVLELAISSGSQFIVTYNERDFRGVERFGIRAVQPAKFLEIIGEAI